MSGKNGIIVLAGGKATRLGCLNKAFIDLDGKPLIKHVISRIMGISPRIVVVIQKNGDKRRFNSILTNDIALTEDVYEEKGPLSGILSGVNNLQTRYVAVVPCDTPFINSDILRFLFHEASNFDAAIPVWPNGFQEPLHAIYRSVVTAEAAKDAIENHELSISAMIRRLDKVNYVSIEKIRKIDVKLDTFFNINTDTDLKKAEEKLQILKRKNIEKCK